MSYPNDAHGWFSSIEDLQKRYLEQDANPEVLIFVMLTNMFVFLIQWRFEDDR